MSNTILNWIPRLASNQRYHVQSVMSYQLDDKGFVLAGKEGFEPSHIEFRAQCLNHLATPQLKFYY